MKSLFTLLFSLFSLNVLAHPHAFVDLKTQALTENQTLKGFRMSWTLDEIASSTLIYEMQSSADPNKTKQDLTQEMIDTAKKDHYFSYLYNQKSNLIPFTEAPSDYGFVVENNRIIFSMNVYLSEPQKLSTVPITLMSYEPTYYMAMEYNYQSDVSIDDKKCEIKVVQPKVDDTLKLYASSLDKDQTPEDQSLGRAFAQKVEMKCKNQN
ncbi:DUF1007 family protein [Haemophilus sp. Marseille-Q0026]|jgi:uncharacterized protein HI_1249|uniref:DUF1007 family protein n=1 Tax=Haemophilus sp. Marseille-Q0026 TaxID=2866580 RepID=UPI001CF8F045|nr:DUF1007 family protein [Haemophilus sp. Marseille-Q0026]